MCFKLNMKYATNGKGLTDSIIFMKKKIQMTL